MHTYIYMQIIISSNLKLKWEGQTFWLIKAKSFFTGLIYFRDTERKGLGAPSMSKVKQVPVTFLQPYLGNHEQWMV